MSGRRTARSSIRKRMRRQCFGSSLAPRCCSRPGENLNRFSRYAINVVMTDPLDRQGTLKTVRATHLLVLHEFRRYVRVPMITEVRIEHAQEQTLGHSIEVSGGGMSLNSKLAAKLGSAVEVFFSLPGTQALSCSA